MKKKIIKKEFGISILSNNAIASFVITHTFVYVSISHGASFVKTNKYVKNVK